MKKRMMAARSALLPLALSAAALGDCRSGASGEGQDALGEIRTSLSKMTAGYEKVVTDTAKAILDAQAAGKDVTALKEAMEKAVGEVRSLKEGMDELRRASLRKAGIGVARKFGQVSDDCARSLASVFILGGAKRGMLDGLESGDRDRLIKAAAEGLGTEVRTALTTSDIALPVEHSYEIKELIADFGVARNQMTRWPIGRGTSKPPRMKTRVAFAKIAMSAAITEQSPQVELAALESHKIGGLIRIPRELDEQSVVAMGQFLARYGAVEFARAEDTWAFLADGSATYESVKGITKIAVDNSRNVQLAATKTKPSDVTLADLRAMRLLVNSAALGLGAKYYLHSTWESQLRTFNTSSDPFAYVPNAPGTRDAIGGPNLDGYPIVWTDVLQNYVTTAQVSKFCAVFGVLQYWWFGEHLSPRLDYSKDVFFTTDEIAARFIEEIDFDYMDVGATSSLQLAAS